MHLFLTRNTTQKKLAITAEADQNGQSETVSLGDLQANAQYRSTAISMQHLHDMQIDKALVNLDQRGIKREAVEGALANIIYANHSSTFFAVIELASRLKNDPQIRDIDEITISLPKQDRSVSIMLQRELKKQFPHIKISKAAGGFPLWAVFQGYFCLFFGLAISGIGVLLSILRRENFGRKQDIQITAETFVLFPSWRNDTKHAWRYLHHSTAETDSPSTLFLTGHPITKQPPRKLPAEMETKTRAYRTWRPSDYGAVCLVLGKSWSTIWKLLSTVFEDMQSPLSSRIKGGMKAAYMLSAGLLRQKWVEHSTFSGTGVIIFGYSPQTAPDIMFDLALQKKGFTTIHWLHGVVAEVLGYRGYSSICLCRTLADADEMRKLGTYGRCDVTQFGETSGKQPDSVALSDKPKGTVVITNFIHPYPFYTNEDALKYLFSLLETVAAVAADHKTMAPLIWRPHPHSSHPRLRKLMLQATEKAQGLGFKVDNTSPLQFQINQSRFLICTYSTTLIDVIESGFVPALFTLNPIEEVCIWDVIPDSLKFQNSGELRDVLAVLENPVFVKEIHARLVKDLNVSSQSIPSAGYFQHHFL
ncbi:MAG: hypothetical protein HY866_16285 [Chloroflexi bacterium]|nr:hypothetical protein [Chloroflexota bacterium]